MSAELRPGVRVGEYVLVSPLGEGGFASVWLAQHRAWPERRVAAKIIRDREELDSLRAEARCLALLSHPNIAGAVGMDLDHDPPYLLVELHEGRTLRQVLAEGPLAPERARRIFAQIAAAIAASHERGVVHGDLKPENVLVAADDRVKVADFGLGRVRAMQASVKLSASLASGRNVAGTIPYMAPEQQDGEPPDPRTDVFTLGILLHEIVTGKRPQPGDVLGGEWADAFSRCYARRDRRFEDAGELVRSLGVVPEAAPVAVAGPRKPLWRPEEVEAAICAEAGIELDALVRGKVFRGARARSVAIYILHEHLGLSAPEIAARYAMPASKVRSKLEASSPPETLLRGACERLAALSPEAMRRVAETESALEGWLAGAVGGFTLAVLALIAMVVFLVGGNVPLTFGLGVAAPVLIALGQYARRRYDAALERLDEVLPVVEGADARERLERLSIRHDQPLVRRRAKRLLEGAKRVTPPPLVPSEAPREARARVEGPVKVEPVKVEPVKVEPVKVEPVRAKPEQERVAVRPPIVVTTAPPAPEPPKRVLLEE